MGLIQTKRNLGMCEKMSVSGFCRRRLPVVMVRLKFAETLKEAVTYIEQGRKLVLS
jgi:U3 small nucleolar ribonucleoprotein protein IMP3